MEGGESEWYCKFVRTQIFVNHYFMIFEVLSPVLKGSCCKKNFMTETFVILHYSQKIVFLEICDHTVKGKTGEDICPVSVLLSTQCNLSALNLWRIAGVNGNQAQGFFSLYFQLLL